MRFRLTYAGSLHSSNPLAGEEDDGTTEAQRRLRRAARKLEHKHDIRRYFHPQLRELWRTNKFLSGTKLVPYSSYGLLPERARGLFQYEDETREWPMAEALGRAYEHSGYKWTPLVRKEISLACSLRVLCLRREHPGSVFVARDIDNRVKTLLDALTMPTYSQGSPMRNGIALPPTADEDPFFVLLDDDRQVTHLEVETDTVLELDPQHPEDESFVRLLITVELRPYDVNMFNLSFA